MRRPAITVAAVLVAIVALAGCGSQPGGSTSYSRPGATPSASATAPPPSVGPTSTSPAQPTPPATQPPASGPTAKGSPIGPITDDITLQGTVFQGAEPVCKLLRSGSKSYELLLPQGDSVSVGESVSVTGHEVHGVMSHCMQGIPFQVDKISPN